ncbi:ABC transporter permease [Arthrobacter gengyunqii]|uniref:ABC transporter permease n=1 Tax=Arthrobacter gengyunqii TaxID=2886940 RepID=A0A9X1S5H3_9MICC|nr:ABC transporter permease [Arthrobacter gengyunqii]MCC3269410.1 ABC transporter permease [Arthrobacter gengyunqii]UOY94644.1 ABC transporter permease [Arthrobacter gengyunqii]
MYLALRDIRFAKGRFALMGSVVALISLLLVLLSGLTAGLGNQNTGAVAAFKDHGINSVAFGAPGNTGAKASYTESVVTAEQLREWRNTEGVQGAEPLGITQTRAVAQSTANVAVFGVEPGSALAPQSVDDGGVILGASTAEDLGVDVGGTVALGGRSLTVSAVSEDSWYSHTPVAWASLETWQQVAHTDDASLPDAPVATVIVSTATPDAAAAANASARTVSTDVRGSYSALGSYRSENGSLLLMQAFLYGISALVIVAFLTVWTVQRTRDIAVLKALGGSSSYLLRDALAQAAIVLAGGALLGGLAGVGIGAVAAQLAPFSVSAATTVLPVLGIVLLGLAGAALAVRSVTKVDPLTALGGN